MRVGDFSDYGNKTETTYSMKRLLIPLLVVFLVLAIPSVVGATAPVVTWESYTTGADNATTVYGGHWMAQSFLVEQESHSALWVRLSMYRLGEPGTVVVGLREVDSSGFPTGDDLTTGTIDADVMSNSTASWYTVVLDEYSLVYNTTYAIVVSAESGDASNALYVMSDDSAATYAGGTKIYSTTGGLIWLEDTGHDLQFAISGRALIDITDVKVFQDYYEDGDMLFTIAYENFYVPYYPTDDAPSYFKLQLRDTDGTTLISQTVCWQWGYMPAEIYLSADTAAPLDSGEDYMIVLEGSNLPEAPTTNYTLASDDWKGSDFSQLRTWAINLAKDMEEYYDIELVVASGKEELLNRQAGVFFLTGMPSLVNLVPNLFEVGEVDIDDYATDPYDFDTETTWSTEVGETVSGAVEDTADMMGVETPQHLAGIMLMIGYFILAGIVVAKGGDISIAAFLAIPVILAGTQLRIFPFAFIAAIAGIAVLLLVYRFWWSRT